MMLFITGISLLFFSWSSSVVALDVNPSVGCGKQYDGKLGKLTKEHLFVNSSNGLSTDRRFTKFLPSEYDSSVPLPLMLYFHGQYGNANSDASSSSYVDYPMIQLYLQGMGKTDVSKRNSFCGTGWNTGPSGHDSSTCTNEAYPDSCCYESCMEIGACSGDGGKANCGWSTCYNDADFVSELIQTISNEVCIDMNSIFVTGCSNGGMLTHYLYQALPETFLAALPVYGLPLVGYNNLTSLNNQTSILQLHDRSDTVIPVNGGDGDGWLFESASDVLGSWAALHGCDVGSSPITTPYDGGDTNLSCSEWKHCNDGKLVMLCMYDGEHGSWPQQGEALTFWFFNQTRYL